MEDNKIIKALECCKDAVDNPDFCYECPYSETENCAIEFAKDTFDLVSRQQAKIERQRELLEMADKAMKIANENANLMCEQYKRAKVEAIEEFVERLKDKSLTKWDYHDAVDIEEIDNLVKEMVGDKE